jgi:hypothetical protein
LRFLISFGLLIFNDSKSHVEFFLNRTEVSRVKPPGHECVAAGFAISAVDMCIVCDLAEAKQSVGGGKYGKKLAGKSECPSIKYAKPLQDNDLNLSRK